MPGFRIGGSGGHTSNVVETSRRHRFIFWVMEPLTRPILIGAHKISIPRMETDRSTMHHKQDEIYFPGKQRWTPAKISFYRMHNNDCDQTASELYSWYNEINDLRNSKLRGPDGFVPKRTAEIWTLDGHGRPVYKYHLYGTWPQDIAADDYDAGDSTISDVTVTMSVDKMEEECVGVVGGVEAPTAHCEVNPAAEEALSAGQEALDL